MSNVLIKEYLKPNFGKTWESKKGNLKRQTLKLDLDQEKAIKKLKMDKSGKGKSERGQIRKRVICIMKIWEIISNAKNRNLDMTSRRKSEKLKCGKR